MKPVELRTLHLQQLYTVPAFLWWR